MMDIAKVAIPSLESIGIIVSTDHAQAAVEAADAVLAEKDPDRRLSEVMAAAPALAKHGGDREHGRRVHERKGSGPTCPVTLDDLLSEE
jgi:hypothetical protein